MTRYISDRTPETVVVHQVIEPIPEGVQAIERAIERAKAPTPRVWEMTLGRYALSLLEENEALKRKQKTNMAIPNFYDLAAPQIEAVSHAELAPYSPTAAYNFNGPTTGEITISDITPGIGTDLFTGPNVAGDSVGAVGLGGEVTAGSNERL